MFKLLVFIAIYNIPTTVYKLIGKSVTLYAMISYEYFSVVLFNVIRGVIY